MRSFTIDYTPTEKQAKFHSCPADEVLFGGSAGGGKSMALLMEAIVEALEVPGNRCLLMRRTYPELEKSLIHTSLQIIPKDLGRYNDGKKRWTFVNGSIIDFGYCENENDVTKYQSAEYGFIGFDELTHFTEFQYTYMLSRLRSTVEGVWPRMRAATNPGGVGHAWVKKYFIDPAPPETVWTTDEGLTRCFIPATVYDNPYLMEADPGYIRRLESLDEDSKRALLYGDWDVFAGQAFKEFNRDLHVVKPFSIPKNWTRYRSLDWGYSKPFAVLWGAVDGDENIYIYREFYGCEKGRYDTGIKLDAKEVGKEIAKLSRFEKYRKSVADPACFSKHGYKGETIADLLKEGGAKFERGYNDRIQGKNYIHEKLKIKDDGKPSLFIFENCIHLIRTLPALVYDKSRPEDVDTKGEDHLYDALRYMVSARMRHFTQKKSPVRRPINPYTGR